jgi:hypothetical protein
MLVTTAYDDTHGQVSPPIGIGWASPRRDRRDAFAARGELASGIDTTNVAPSPSRDSTGIVPWLASTIRRTIA